MLFSVAFGVPEKSVFTRLFCVFATDMLANFQVHPSAGISIAHFSEFVKVDSRIFEDFGERDERTATRL